MNHTYKTVILGVVLFSIQQIDAKAQTRLTNPKVHVIDTRTPTPNTTAPYITITNHKLMPAPWILLTPQEFQALSKEEQQNAVSKPDIYIVTNGEKELVIKELQSGQKVENLIKQQELKK